MRRLLAGGLLLLACAAQAEEAGVLAEPVALELPPEMATEALAPEPTPSGEAEVPRTESPPSVESLLVPREYAFDRPELLADQLVWGIAHGARLLALACAQGGHGAAAEAWVTWQEREAVPMAAMNERLGLHYFQRGDVPVDALALALGLRTALDLPPATLDPACATLAEALAQPRYDLVRRREEILRRERATGKPGSRSGETSKPLPPREQLTPQEPSMAQEPLAADDQQAVQQLPRAEEHTAVEEQPAAHDHLAGQGLEVVQAALEGKPPAAPAIEPSAETWEIQLGGFREEWRVRQIVAKIHELGLPTYTLSIQLEKGELKRLRAGPFHTREAAEQARKKLRAIGLDGPVATPLEN